MGALQNIKQKTVCQSVTNHFERTTNVLFFIAFANPLTVLIFHISGMCLRFLLGCGLPGSGFDMDVKHGLE